MADRTPNEALRARITDYLGGGGLFNPELANHDAVRDLLIDCRDALAARAERDRYKAALELIALLARDDQPISAFPTRDIARTALDAEPHKEGE